LDRATCDAALDLCDRLDRLATVLN
jgi:hypothetical protein